MGPQDESSDDELVAASARGDERAFRRLVERHGPRTRSFARRLAGNSADADDYVQEAFTRLWRDAGRWRSEGIKLSTWLARVVTNLSADQARRARVRRSVTMEDAPEPADLGQSAETALIETERRSALDRAISALPERQRAVIALTYGTGLSNSEVATALDTTVEAVEAALTRGRAALKSAMRAQGLLQGTVKEMGS